MDDLLELVKIGAIFHKESCYRDTEFDPYIYAEFLKGVITMPNYCAAVIEQDGKIVAHLLAMVSPFFWNTQPCARDIVVYVNPEKRGTRAFVMLVKEFERWAAEKGAVMPKIVGISTGIDIEKTRASYERLGYTCIGSILAKEL